MEKKFEDDELKKFLEEEYIKEADLMEKALFSDKDFEDLELTQEQIDASFEKLMNRLKAEGLYREDEEEIPKAESENVPEEESEPGQTENPEEETRPDPEKVVPISSVRETSRARRVMSGITRKGAKVALIVIVGAAAIGALSLTSEANRNYVIKKVNYLTGNDTKVIIGNDEEIENPQMDEAQAKEEVENALGIKMPYFRYHPDGLSFKSYQIGEHKGYAYLEYDYFDNIVSFYVSKQGEGDTSSNFSFHGDEVDTIYLEKYDVTVSITKVQDEQDVLPSYTAQWYFGDGFYQISGKMDEEEFLKLIEKMRF
jgi:hypothetical protein